MPTMQLWTIDEVIAEFVECGFTEEAARKILSRYPWKHYKEALLWNLVNRIIREERLFRSMLPDEDFEENELCQVNSVTSSRPISRTSRRK